jgi:hypothetical protein
MHTEGSALVGGFFMSGGLRRGDIPVFFDLTSGKGWKSMLTLFVFYFCQEQGRINEYRACSDLVINLIIFNVANNNIKHIVYFCNFKVS